MSLRKSLFICLVLTVCVFFLVLADGQAVAEDENPCDNMVCGAGYEAIIQSNGSCMCVLLDCDDIMGCPEPPTVTDDCDSLEGCPKPPTMINP